MQRTFAYRFGLIDLVWSLGLGILQRSLSDSQVLNTGLVLSQCGDSRERDEGWERAGS